MGKEEMKFTPSTDTVVVEPIMKARNPLVDDPNHEAYFLFHTAKIEYSLPLDKMGNLTNPFANKAEQEWLEKELDLDLNIHRKKDNEWFKHKVRLDKNPRKLVLGNPKDYMDYLVLRANTRFIAASAETMNDRATYRYALVQEGYKIAQKARTAGSKKDAYKAAAKLETQGREAMIDFLKVYGKKVSEASKIDFLVGQIDDLVESDLAGFLSIVEDKDNYEIKLLLERAIESGAVNRNGRKYYLPGGDPLCGSGDSPTIGNVLIYLKSPANGDILDMIAARVDNAK
jgi:hypothetical protein|tara:strand:- start:602 stop:1459 length:858 start_codon:yes stop_codon:yes gene_type:complete